jgi:hypothetical protein
MNPDILGERAATSTLSMAQEWYVKHTQKNMGVYDRTAFQDAQYNV